MSTEQHQGHQGKQVKKIVIEEVQAMLKLGKTRKQVQEHYELSNKQLKKLFLVEGLKGCKSNSSKDDDSLLDIVGADGSQAKLAPKMQRGPAKGTVGNPNLGKLGKNKAKSAEKTEEEDID